MKTKVRLGTREVVELQAELRRRNWTRMASCFCKACISSRWTCIL